ncbi:hypothetical protein OGAPHI_005952 [Ogataea philodendri]|uniref:Glycoside hydrolase family 5 domain-containing protein n=1 Tax=Ogataea philodendri TaxID=1378263 RepID=A0A9P8T129_9ASCO|nr:uncharacterized protein OGAPHI_005952 [Ogataea philodendri]KAH3661774.1 hypothetical protein OGAPHI_005952 [Ogataea philodendri]
MFDKLKSKLSGDLPAATIPSGIDRKTIYQYRQNFGVNFGSVFVLEKYIFDSLFSDTQYELDAVKKSVKEKGLDQTRKDFEAHWTGYATDDDWNWLKSKGVQSIRLPIGYWEVNSGKFAKGTSFESVAGVYENAWSIIKQLIQKAANYNISVLVDLHAVPRGANTGDHSGEHFDQAGFWSSSKSIGLAVETVKYMAEELSSFENISGLQVVNESVFDDKASGQKKYYSEAIKAIRSVNKDIPIVISDGWWADQWVQFVNENSKNGDLGVVIDDHIYRCFSDDDKNKGIDQIISDLEGSVLTGLSGQADFLIGEYSCVLDGSSWGKGSYDRGDCVRKYGNEQARLFQQRAGAGYYFWTYKFQHGDGGEWGFRPMVDSGCIPARSTDPHVPSDDDKNRILNENLSGHENYWNQQNPNEKYEHWRYKEGFETAWNDSLEFAKFDNSRIGRRAAWKAARRQQHISSRGNSGFIWEWEQGFDKALEAFGS